MQNTINKREAIGLCYVGAYLACKLAIKYNVVEFDVNSQRVEELSNKHDKTL